MLFCQRDRLVGERGFEPLLPRTVILAESLQVTETNKFLNCYLRLPFVHEPHLDTKPARTYCRTLLPPYGRPRRSCASNRFCFSCPELLSGHRDPSGSVAS